MTTAIRHNKYVVLLLCTLLAACRLAAQVTSFNMDSSQFNKALLPVLDSIYHDDQFYRLQMLRLIKNKAAASSIDSIKTIIQTTDHKNLVKVNRIIQQHGWLGPQEVGMNGSQALFLVIQHADLATQQKYYPMIRQAEKDGKTLSSNLAILEDRIAMREGKKQLYGSQGFTDKATGITYIYPVADVDNLDKRRQSMGLPPMKTYAANWDLEAYKKQLPEIEQIAQRQNIH